MNKQTCSISLKDIIFLNIKLECLLIFSQALYAHILSQIQRVINGDSSSSFFFKSFFIFFTCVFVILLH
jgi:hypothetical protein